METALIQLWETFEEGEHQSDGCSLHLNMIFRNQFLDKKESSENPVGLPTEVSLSKKLSEILSEEKDIRLSEIEMNNLLGLKDITVL